MERYYPLHVHYRRRHGRRVQKIPLDAGFTCPNRDGTLSREGCVFCNPAGSGSSMHARGLGLAEQWADWAARARAKYGDPLLMAYLQSYSNTHGPFERVRAVLEEIAALPDVHGLCIGTRPDCLDGGRLELLAGLGLAGVQLDLGLQSANDATLARINRGHDAAAFAEAARRASALGMEVCAHLVAGLPGENGDDLLASVEFLNALPVTGVKFHNLYVAEHTALAESWRCGEYAPPALGDYVSWTCAALARLRPDIVVHRLNGDPARDELLAPDWAGNKHAVLGAIRARLEAHDLWQGKDAPEPARTIPGHFSLQPAPAARNAATPAESEQRTRS